MDVYRCPGVLSHPSVARNGSAAKSKAGRGSGVAMNGAVHRGGSCSTVMCISVRRPIPLGSMLLSRDTRAFLRFMYNYR